MNNIFAYGEYFEALYGDTFLGFYTQSQGYCSEYDLIGPDGESYEIKAENSKWEKTGNHFVELWNLDKDIPSGLNATKSDYWVVALAKEYDLVEWIKVRVNDLKELVKHSNFKEAKATIDVKVRGVLVPLNELRKINIKENKMEIKNTGKLAQIGYVNGIKNWEKKDKDGKPTTEIVRGITKNGKKYQDFMLAVSKKNDNSINSSGKDYFEFKVRYYSEIPLELGAYTGLVMTVDFYNMKDKEGKYKTGLTYTAWEGDMFSAEDYFNGKKSNDSKEAKVEEEYPF